MGKSWEELVCMGNLWENRRNTLFQWNLYCFFTFFQELLCILWKSCTFVPEMDVLIA